MNPGAWLIVVLSGWLLGAALTAGVLRELTKKEWEDLALISLAWLLVIPASVGVGITRVTVRGLRRLHERNSGGQLPQATIVSDRHDGGDQ